MGHKFQGLSGNWVSVNYLDQAQYLYGLTGFEKFFSVILFVSYRKVERKKGSSRQEKQGAPNPDGKKYLDTLGDHHFRVLEFCKNLEQTAYVAQMNYIDPIYFHGTSVVAGYTVEEITDRAKHHSTKLIARLTELE